jgi:hypothetical protein
MCNVAAQCTSRHTAKRYQSTPRMLCLPAHSLSGWGQPVQEQFATQMCSNLSTKDPLSSH